MNKLLLSAALIVTSAAAIAQIRGGGYMNVTPREVVQNSARTHEILSNEIYNLSSEQLRLVNEKLHEIREIVRGYDNGGGRPHPVPVPVPQPNPPPYSQRQLVRGTVENVEFSFEVEDLMGLHQQCVAFVSSKALLSVDDIQVSINFGPIETLRNAADYWKGANRVCAQIEQKAKARGLALPRTGQWILIGTVETVDFSFTGYDKIEINRQCENFLNQKGLRSVDDIVVSTNFGSEQVLRNAADYWKNNIEICSQIMKYMY